MAAPVALIPASPLLVPALTPHVPAHERDAVDDLRAAAHAALAGLGTERPVIVVAPGSPVAVDGPNVDFASLGVADAGAATAPTGDLAASLPTGAPAAAEGAALAIDTAVLVRAVAEVATVPVLALQLEGAPTEELLTGLAGADAPLVIAGDLSPCLDRLSPGYVVDGAPAWDAEVVAALRAGDLDALRSLDGDAGRVRARAWPLPRLAAELAQHRDLALDALTYHDVRGVGRVVARWS